MRAVTLLLAVFAVTAAPTATPSAAAESRQGAYVGNQVASDPLEPERWDNPVSAPLNPVRTRAADARSRVAPAARYAAAGVDDAATNAVRPAQYSQLVPVNQPLNQPITQPAPPANSATSNRGTGGYSYLPPNTDTGVAASADPANPPNFSNSSNYEAPYSDFSTDADANRFDRNDLQEAAAGRQDRNSWMRDQQNSTQTPTIRPPAEYNPNMQAPVPDYLNGTTTNAQRARQRMTAHVASGSGLDNADPRTTAAAPRVGSEVQLPYTVPVSDGAQLETPVMRPPVASGSPTATDSVANTPLTSGSLPRSGSLDPYQQNTTTNGLPPELEQAKSEEGGTKAGTYFFTLLALFASLGMNLYLGWIAWDTYNRYQDLVADMRQSSSRRDRDRDDRDSAPRRNRRLAEAY